MPGKKILDYVILSVTSIVFLYALFSLVGFFLEYREGEQEYEDLNQYAVVSGISLSSHSKEDTRHNNTADIKDEDDEEILTIQFDHLKNENPDIVGWIQFPNNNISYPVVQGSDNDFYLNHTFRKVENKAGAIFMDANDNSDMTGDNTFLYGHNMKNGTMFGLLSRYKDPAFYEENPYFYYYTPEFIAKYSIFSFYTTDASSDSYQHEFASQEAFVLYLNMITGRSVYAADFVPISDSPVLTLSTCTSRNELERFLVHGQLTEVIPIGE